MLNRLFEDILKVE